MKTKNYQTLICVHMQRDDNLCRLTDKYCVGFDLNYSSPRFGNDAMTRCPMYKIDSKRFIRKSLLRQDKS